MKKKKRNSQARTYVAAAAILTFFVVVSWLVYTKSNLRSVLGGSTIRATLCDATSTPEITIFEPESDSIVDTTPLVIQGSALRTTQIDVFVNNAFNRTVVIDDDGPFQAEADLQEGTNTVRLEAQFACNQTSAAYNLILTYEPKVGPSPGENVDTEIPPVAGGSVPGNNHQRPSRSRPYAPNIPIGTDGPIKRIGKKLRIIPATGDTIDSQSFTTAETTLGWAMVLGILFGLVLLIAPGVLVSGGIGFTSSFSGVINGRQVWLIRGFGFSLTILLLYLLQL